MRIFLALVLSTGTQVLGQPLYGDSPPSPLHEQQQEQAQEKKPPAKLPIGVVAGLPRPEGFVVQDLRSAEQRTATPFKQTYKAPMPLPFQRQPVPLAKYERVIGEEELSASPVDLLAEKLVERYGAKLTGKRLVVHEFSYRLEQVVNKPQGMSVSVIGGSLGGAILMSVIGSVAGTAMLQGKGIDLKLHVKIDAELDGTRIEASELPMTLRSDDGPARVTRYAVEKFQYRFDAATEPAPAAEKTEEPKKD